MFSPYYKRQPKETHNEDSGTDTENSEMRERVNRRKAADKEKRKQKKLTAFEN